MSPSETTGVSFTNAQTIPPPVPAHPHPRSSWRYLEAKEEYPWAGGSFVFRQHATYFLCEECGQTLRVVAQDVRP